MVFHKIFYFLRRSFKLTYFHFTPPPTSSLLISLVAEVSSHSESSSLLINIIFFGSKMIFVPENENAFKLPLKVFCSIFLSAFPIVLLVPLYESLFFNPSPISNSNTAPPIFDRCTDDEIPMSFFKYFEISLLKLLIYFWALSLSSIFNALRACKPLSLESNSMPSFLLRVNERLLQISVIYNKSSDVFNVILPFAISTQLAIKCGVD